MRPEPHLCPDCLSNYKRKIGGSARAYKIGAPWGRGNWAKELYHNEPTRKCRKHHVQSCADSAAYRAGLSKATPKWADRIAIKKIYAEAIRMSRETGVRYEVDHIHPLHGKKSNGLHVPYNLQIIPAHVNRKKSNREYFV